MVHQQDVPADHSDIRNQTAIAVLDGGDTHREGQRIFLSPPDFHDQLTRKRVHGLRDSREAHNVAVARIGVGLISRPWSLNFLEDDDVAFVKMKLVSCIRGCNMGLFLGSFLFC